MRDRSSVELLVRFSRLASEASSGSEILPLLVEAAIDHVQADGAVVVQVSDAGGARAAAARGVPDAVASWQGDADAMGGELGDELLKHAGGKFARAVPLPLVRSGGLFGTLVLFFVADREATEDRLQIARALADLAAIALGRAAHIAKLAQTNADLTASREVLARTEKLRALGQMAAGVSHDLKNILNPISMHAQIIQRALARGDTAQALATVEEQKQVVRRGVETLERLRAFSRQSPGTRAEKVDLATLAREAIAIARPRMSSAAGALSRIVEDLHDVPPVVARGDEVVAAVVNLVVNAIDAMPDGGTITVRTGSSEGHAWISVVDTGPGMTPEVQARVFEPFFTTKGVDGTGLGLAMVFSTMQRYGGNVSLETSPGRGAAFTLTFPAAPSS
jgi:signal transduction histidine kinase